MKTLFITMLTATLLFSSIHLEACEQPNEITFPDGATASAKDIEEADRAVKGYMSAMRAYQACLESEADRARLSAGAADKQSEQDRENDFVRKHNAALEAMKQTAARFQDTVNAYQAKT
ncbi:MAG: hypothetical protein OEY04_12065 [Gammaproteobacteria bacterium]|nr:hypothetical protein [Gammaproteobacteria bacterium]